jgi:bis(5'-nucleosyl)-tetraphosphatase (symmetrical)
MSVYWVGDIQGCDEPLGQLLDQVGFSVSRDRLYVLGDLVNRGPDSLAVLRRLSAMGTSVKCVLGNHDLHLLAIHAGARAAGKMDTLAEVLEASDKANLLTWLRHQPLALFEEDVLMVHAGVLPQWTVAKALALADEVQAVLRSQDANEFFMNMYGNQPNQWQDNLQTWERLRCAVNAFTRLRFCSADGHMEFETKEGAGKAPVGYMPWFEVPDRQTAHATLAFGHWSTLGAVQRQDVWALDTGCVWGGCLTAIQRNSPQDVPTRIEIKCRSYQTPF